MIVEVMIGVFFALCVRKIIEIVTKRGTELTEAKKLMEKSSQIAKDHVKKTFDKAISEMAKSK